MKRLLVTLALASIAVPSFAAIQYEFMLKNTSDDAAKPSSDMTGRATIDGFRSRVEFLSGNLYPPNTYVSPPTPPGACTSSIRPSSGSPR
jgi:hypothetical protein